MRSYQHYPVTVGQDESVKVKVSKGARIYLLDETNMNRLRQRQRFRYFGRRQPRTNVVIRPDQPGNWHVVIADASDSRRLDGLAASISVV